MAGEAKHSDQILREARQSLINQRAGGRRVASIGQRSAAIKRSNLKTRLRNILLAVAGIWVFTGMFGFIDDGVGILGVFAMLVASVIAIGLFASFPRVKTPTRASLSGSDVKSLVGRTELWLESQRPALPAPAVQLVDQIGGQLDALGLQLDGLDDNVPAAAEVRRLVGEHLPELVSSYTSIPRHLRTEERSGRTPDQQLTESLGKISTEIDSVTSQLASGAIDNLAIKTRYLDYKYGDALDETGTPA